MRIGVGLIVLIDLGDWFYWAPEILSDAGLAPRVVESFLGISANRWSFYFLAGSTAFIRSLLGVNLLAALALTLGIFPRVAAFLCWVFYLSLHHRVHFPLQAADVVIRTALFWMIWLPIGEQLAVRSRWTTPATPPRTIVSGPGVGLIFLMFWLYFGAAVAKLSDLAWLDGVAFYYALSVDEFPTSLASHFLDRFREYLPILSPLLTYLVLAMEGVVPWTLISPWRTSVLRVTGISCLLALQTLFSLFLRLGLFNWQCWAVLLGLLPREIWGKSAQTKPLPPDPWRTRDSVIVAALLVLVVDSALLSLQQPFGVPEWARLPLQSFGYGGGWPMFTQTATISQRWNEIRGHLADGSVVDVFRRGEPVRDRDGPNRDEKTVVFNQRSMSIYRFTFPGGAWQFRAVARYLCTEWNATAPAGRQADVLEFVSYRRDVAPYFVYGSTERSVKYRWLCGAEKND